ncbi:wall-associated receptor kinase-like 2 [Lotus japonicus]|uniref:LysM type receptor kinase n=1 Tax=Lotus japonicus TaxID=34305 RepID=D3KU04_LOTJA|nr:wall-associated receptor kinase-like 2 [Lotus japonicus]BAI79281.1 LysM type receptor kinase [Lotus japonicus]
MELHYHLQILSTTLLLFMFPQPLNSQQLYLNSSVYDCTDNPSAPKGYLCNGLKKSCTSFLVFTSKPPYDNPLSIAYLLGSEASTIASINNISMNGKIPTNKSVIVPVFCSCSGNIYQHSTPYTVVKNDTYYMLVKTTYQGLTTCQAMMGQNYYAAVSIAVGAELTVPVLCACPTSNLIAKGVSFLLVHMVRDGEMVNSIGEAYGVDEQSMREANGLPVVPSSANNSVTLNALTPILVPLRGQSCKENPDKFYCKCSQALHDGSSKGLFCNESDGQKFPAKLVVPLGVGIGAGFLCLFVSGYKLYQYIQKKRKRIHTEKLFRQNGGYLLQEKFSLYGNGEKAKLFTAEELQRATDNYNRSRFLGQGGYGMVYKGMLPDGTIVAVKRSKEIERSQIDTFVNEVVILSQINHRNIVKLLGCCLETETPLLVYEFIPNGTLSQHIHMKNYESSSSLPWESRLRIACEVAGALAYMHFSASIPIFHRDIKPTNILLDSNFCAKVSDFGTSKSVPQDKTHLTTNVKGTFGYIDPEYFQSCQFTDKSDVYSFGVVLVELITGKRPISFFYEDEGQNLVGEFISLMKEDQLSQILDPVVVKEARIDDILSIASLARRCLRLNGKKRPTMKEVSAELEALRKVQNTLQINHDHESPGDGQSTKYTNSDIESREESFSLSLQLESTSF